MRTATPTPIDGDHHYVVWLCTGEEMPDGELGQKAADLRRLAEAGCDVPNGFVLTTTACSDALDRCGVRAELRRLWSSPLPDTVGERARRWQEVADVVARIAVPDELADQIVAARHCLNPPGTPMAVRSSPPADHDHPGFHVGFTDVRGSQDLVRRVRDCWLGPHGTAAVSPWPHRPRRVEPVTAVLVQRMIDGDSTGLAGLGPLGELVVEASPGRGPKSTALDERQAARLRAIAHEVAEIFGRPTVVEWALNGDRLWLLQVSWGRDFGPGPT